MTAFNAPSHINNIVVDTIELRFTEMAEYDSNGFNLGEFNFTLAPATPTNYTVTFLGANDTELKVQEVEPGQDASAPEVPFTPGFLFQDSWDQAFTNVNSDLTVRAEFKRAFMVLNYSIDAAVGVYIESDTRTNNGSPVYEHTEKTSFYRAKLSHDGNCSATQPEEFATAPLTKRPTHHQSATSQQTQQLRIGQTELVLPLSVSPRWVAQLVKELTH